MDAAFALNSLSENPAKMRVGLAFAYAAKAKILMSMRDYDEAFEAAAEAAEEAILNSMVTAKEKRGLDGARYRSLAEFLEIPGFLK